jgi:hypothetical protein
MTMATHGQLCSSWVGIKCVADSGLFMTRWLDIMRSYSDN